MGLKREGTVLLKKDTRHSLYLCAATKKNNRIGSAPFRQASNNARGNQTATPLNIPVFWDMTMDQPFGEAFCLHLQKVWRRMRQAFVYYKIFIKLLRLAFKDHVTDVCNCVEHYKFSNKLTNQVTNQLTKVNNYMEQSHCRDTSRSAKPDISRTLWNPKFQYSHIRRPPGTSWATSIQSTTTSCCLNIYFNIVLPSTPRSSNGLFHCIGYKEYMTFQKLLLLHTINNMRCTSLQQQAL